MIRVVMAQLAFPVGDVAGNAERVAAAARCATQAHGADVVVFPELALTGYPPEDLLYRDEFLVEVERALAQLCRAAVGVTLVVGAPRRVDGRLYNAAWVLRDGRVAGVYHKHHLPNQGVFDERRYFSSGQAAFVFEQRGVRFGLSICEDLWHPGPYERAVAAGADVMVNINASPYHAGKVREREAVIRARQQAGAVPVIYVNPVGGQDEVVYDGVSCAIDADGRVTHRAPAYVEGLFPVDLDVGPTRGVVLRTGEVTELANDDALTYAALVVGTRDYVRRHRFPGVLLGLSGGVDSAMTAAIAVDALGADQVHAVMLASRYTSRESLEDAEACAGLLGIRYSALSIEPLFDAGQSTLGALFAGLAEDVTEENMQSRCRGLLLMALSNKFGSMVLTTGNKSEYAVGYATLYGDMCGGFAPLKDVYKTVLYRLAEWRNARGAVMPRRILAKAPTAELREGQKDQDSLPPYPVLDRILAAYVDQDQSAAALLAAGEDPAVVSQVLSLLHRNEYKRRQSAPGVKVTRKAFGRERRYPITSGFRPL
jgi:NAD+ synthase (glutamine-hydrolysing)